MPVLPHRLAAAALAALVAAALPACSDSPHVRVTETDVTIMAETTGVGKRARNGDIVCIDYSLRTPDGTELIWGTNFRFELGAGAVITGLDETVPGMQRGGSRTVLVPAHKHWGRAGYADAIPERTPLVMDVKLTGIE